MDRDGQLAGEDQLSGAPALGMSAHLPVIEIPGYAEAVRREDAARRRAWVNPQHEICGISIRPLTLRTMEQLAELQNGFFLPWKFESDEEFMAHCAQLVWWLSAAPKPKAGDGWWRRRYVVRAKEKLVRQLVRDPAALVAGVSGFLEEMFLDAVGGSSDGVRVAPIAGTPAFVADSIVAAGYPMTPEQVMDTPLPQLWQLQRVSAKRLTGTTPPNRSDKIATDYLAKLKN